MNEDLEVVRQRIIRRTRKMKADAQQFINDVEYWNKTRTDAEPFDCEIEKVFLADMAGIPDDPALRTMEQREQCDKAMDRFQRGLIRDVHESRQKH